MGLTVACSTRQNAHAKDKRTLRVATLPESAKMLRDIVFRRHLDMCRWAMFSDTPTCVELITVRLTPGERDVLARPCASPTAKAAWLHVHMPNLKIAGTMFGYQQAIYGSVEKAIPKGVNYYHYLYRMITDCRAVNDTIEPADIPGQNIKDNPSLLAGATGGYMQDTMQCYWQVPPSDNAQEMFTMLTPEGGFRHRMVVRRGR